MCGYRPVRPTKPFNHFRLNNIFKCKLETVKNVNLFKDYRRLGWENNIKMALRELGWGHGLDSSGTE
jgi:hypothetical protein